MTPRTGSGTKTVSPRRSFAVEPGYLYSVVISWGDGWFVEYPIRVIEAAA